MNTSFAIVDLVIVAVVVISLLVGKSRGLFRTLAELLSYIVAWVFSSILADLVSVKVAAWLRPAVEEKLQQVAAEMVASFDLQAGLEGLRDALPGELGILLRNVQLDGEILFSLEQALESGLKFDFGPYVEETLHSVAYLISFIVLFILVMVVLRLLIRAMDVLTKLPVIHQLNTLGGAVVGAGKGVVLVLVLVWLSRETGMPVSQEVLDQSLIVSYLQGIFPL